jgi:hypothetical protein
MTSSEIVYKLKNDFPFLVATIVANNPQAVTTRLLEVWGKGEPENVDALYDSVMEIAETGQHNDLVNYILSVPFLSTNASPELEKAWETVKGQVSSVADGGATITAFQDWSGGMFSAIGSLGGAFLGGQMQGGSNQPMYIAPAPAKKDNTIWYVLGAIVVVILVVVVIFAMKKR